MYIYTYIVQHKQPSDAMQNDAAESEQAEGDSERGWLPSYPHRFGGNSLGFRVMLPIRCQRMSWGSSLDFAINS